MKCQEIQEAHIVASYLSYQYEPGTEDLNLALIAAGKELLLPRLLPNNDLEWVGWNGDISHLKQNGKIKEPKGPAYSSEAQIDVVIVPALHIDHEGNRLGQGGGSYDRALHRLSAERTWKIGLVGSDELTSEKIPVEPHDQRVHAAATPDLIIRFRNPREHE
jgi:5-formyltetrahydrofolate cyclo-ligase